MCASLPLTTYVVQWNNSHVWKVGGRVFAIGSLTKNSSLAFTFKVSDVNFNFLSDYDHFRPAPYFASRGMKWIQYYGCLEDKDEQLIYYLKESYRIVLLGLSKKKQKELDLE